MSYDLSLVPRNLIIGIDDLINELFVFFEETDIHEMKYEDICFVREKIYALAYMKDILK